MGLAACGCQGLILARTVPAKQWAARAPMVAHSLQAQWNLMFPPHAWELMLCLVKMHHAGLTWHTNGRLAALSRQTSLPPCPASAAHCPGTDNRTYSACSRGQARNRGARLPRKGLPPGSLTECRRLSQPPPTLTGGLVRHGLHGLVRVIPVRLCFGFAIFAVPPPRERQFSRGRERNLLGRTLPSLVTFPPRVVFRRGSAVTFPVFPTFFYTFSTPWAQVAHVACVSPAFRLQRRACMSPIACVSPAFRLH